MSNTAQEPPAQANGPSSMEKIYARLALAYFAVATFLLMGLAFGLLVFAIWTAVESLAAGDQVGAALDSIGMQLQVPAVRLRGVL